MRVAFWRSMASGALMAILLSGCQTKSGLEAPRKPLRADFSGSWEMDYSLNDSLEGKLDQYFYAMRRQMQRQSGTAGADRRQGQSYAQMPNANTVVAMARFADQITRATTTLDIEQTYNHINVEREDSFALACEFGENEFDPYENLFGKEVCGWDGHQLVFHLNLPGGVAIQHRLTLGPKGEKLNVATTIYNDQVARPFTLNRVYMHFERLPSDFQCKQTVTKGKVCSLVSRDTAGVQR